MPLWHDICKSGIMVLWYSMKSRSRHIRLTFQAMLAAAVVMHACGAMAAQATSRVRVEVAPVDELRVSDAADGVRLALEGSAGGVGLTGAPDATARLDYVHNSGVARKITAEVLSSGMPQTPSDITLSLSIAGGPERVVVDSGVPSGPIDVLGGIQRGWIRPAAVSYSARATAGVTPPGSYGFTVTFTSLADQ